MPLEGNRNLTDETKSGYIRLLPHRHSGGLFSQINFIITQIEALGHSDFYVDWTREMPHAQGNGVNLFDFLFLQSSPGCGDAATQELRDWPHCRYTGSEADTLYLSDFDGWRWRLHDCWRLLRVRPELLEEAGNFCADWSVDACAIHVRNSKIGVECPGGRAPTLLDYAGVLMRFNGPVFLATDNQEAVEFFTRLLGQRLITRQIGRSPDMETEYHLHYHQSVRDAQNCLIDALVMSRCRHLIHSVSNIATAALYINPKIDHTYVRAGGSLRIAPQKQDWSPWLLRRALAESIPKRTIILARHTSRDVILEYENGIFSSVDDLKQGGSLRHSREGGMELQWVNGETEHWSPSAPEILEGLNQNPYPCYQLRKINRVTVDLSGSPGDQMFQYAFGLAMTSIWGNAELRVAQTNRKFPFALSRFGIHLSRLIPIRDYYIDWNGDYDDGIIEDIMAGVMECGTNNLWLEGQFQNDAFFSVVAEEVREKFSLPRQPLPKGAEKGTSVAVHINSGGNHEGMGRSAVPASYYREALRLMRSCFADAVFLVFHDGTGQYADFLMDETNIILMPPMDILDSMAWMRSCSAFVLSDSTLCWWPAWLSGSKHIIRPDWPPGNRNGIYPSEWIPLRSCLVKRREF